jgi:hypothetical protein
MRKLTMALIYKRFMRVRSQEISLPAGNPARRLRRFPSEAQRPPGPAPRPGPTTQAVTTAHIQGVGVITIG